MYDAIVIGGGPGGSTTAALLAQQGHRVLLLEKEHFPRFHVGESLLPYNMEVWQRLGIVEEMTRRYIRKEGAVFVSAEDGATNRYYFRQGVHPEYTYAFQVPRSDFDDLLLRNAVRLGAEVREGVRVKEAIWEKGRLVGVRAQEEGASEDTEFRARMVVDASGQQTFLGSALSLKIPDPAHRKVALFAHWDGAEREGGSDEGNILISSCPDARGWIWFIPFKGERTSIGVVMDSEVFRARGERSLDDLYEGMLRSVPLLWRRLEGARRTVEVHSIANFSYRCRQYAGPGWVMVGDAAAFLDPIFSSGVYLAMASGARAADVIHAALERGRLPQPQDFRGFVKTSRAGLSVFTRFIHGWYEPSFRYVFMRPPPGDSAIQRVVTAVLAGEVKPGLRTSFWQQAFFLVVWLMRRHRLKAGGVPDWFQNQPREMLSIKGNDLSG